MRLVAVPVLAYAPLTAGLLALVRPAWIQDWRGAPPDLQVATAAGLLAGAIIIAEAIAAAARGLMLSPWPRVLRRRAAKRCAAYRDERQKAADIAEQGMGPEMAPFDAVVHRIPADPERQQPTRAGNAVAAAQERVHVTYGLDLAVAWPAIWLLLDDGERKALAGTWHAVELRVRGAAWSLTAALWAPVHAAALLGLPLAWAFMAWVSDAVEAHVALVEATVALHRLELYDRMGVPRPARDGEAASGRALSAELYQGRPPA